MSQSRAMSVVETVTNVVVGFALAVLTQVFAFPLFGLRVPLGEHLKIGLLFTAVSILRGHALRRFFERLGHRGRAERRGSP